MAQKKSYSRYFIILQEDEKGYSLSADKIVSGYLKSELKNDKCKISYYVQNLKKQSIPYHMVLICNKKDVNKIIKIGKMNIDDYGRADISYEYPANNIAGTGIAADKVSGAAIVKFLDSNVISIMSGFTSKQIPDWKNFDLAEGNLRGDPEEEVAVKSKLENDENKVQDDEKIVEINKGTDQEIKEKVELNKDAQQVTNLKSKKESADILNDKNELDDEKSIFDKYEEIIENDKKLKDQENRDKKHIDNKNNEKLDMDNVKSIDQSKEQTKQCLNVEYTQDKLSNQNVNKVESQYEDYGATIPMPAQSFFRQLVDKFESADVCDDIKRCDWYKVKVDSIRSMYDLSDYNKYAIVYHPMIDYYNYIKKYGFYMIGYKHDKMGQIKYLVYGIPGSKSKYDQPFGGKSGFVTWVPFTRNETQESYQGCWLMFYDFKTSTVVIPIKR